MAISPKALNPRDMSPLHSSSILWQEFVKSEEQRTLPNHNDAPNMQNRRQPFYKEHGEKREYSFACPDWKISITLNPSPKPTMRKKVRTKRHGRCESEPQRKKDSGFMV